MFVKLFRIFLRAFVNTETTSCRDLKAQPGILNKEAMENNFSQNRFGAPENIQNNNRINMFRSEFAGTKIAPMLEQSIGATFI